MYLKQISCLTEKINKVRNLFLSSDQKEINFLDFIKFVFSNIKGTHLVEHTFYVAEISLLIAQEFGLSPLEQSILYWASVLHDLGKVHMPDEIILSPHRLTDEEYAVMKMHPSISAEIAAAIPVFTENVLIGGRSVKVTDIILYHHERIDGKGYFGLKGQEIPYLAKIMAVADAFAAMTDKTRRFNRGRSALIEDVIIRMKKDNGTQFDANILTIFELALVKYHNKIDPDFSSINEIFNKNKANNALPLIKHSELFSFIEKFVNKKREIVVNVSGKNYTITEIEEPYIIDQRPDNAYIMIHEGEKELAVVTQKKYLMSKEEAFKCLQFDANDFGKAYSFMDIKNNKFFFTSLNLTKDAFRKKLNMFGSFTRDELRVFLEDNLDLENEKIKETQAKLEEFFLTRGLAKEVGQSIFSIQQIDILTLSELRGVVDFRVLLKFLTANYVKNVEVKRELILRKWEEVKNKTINHSKNEFLSDGVIIDDETLFKITPFIDYIPKINFRGVNLVKLKYILEGYLDKLYENNDLKKKKIYHALLLYYFIEMTGLMDEYFSNIKGKNIAYSKNKIFKISQKMHKILPELKEELTVVKRKIKQQIKDKYKKDFMYFGKEALISNIIDVFFGTNGLITEIDRLFLGAKEKDVFFDWLLENKEILNPKMSDYFKSILK